MGERALDQQERAIAGLRTRTAALLATAALTASFLGDSAIDRGGFGVAAITAIAALILAGGLALTVLWPARLRFAIDTPSMYDELYEHQGQPDVFLIRAANVMQAAYDANRDRIDRREVCFRWAIGAVGVGVETVAWLAAIALA